jgi:hypothetical protein
MTIFTDCHSDYAEWPAAFAFGLSNIDSKKTHVGTFRARRDGLTMSGYQGKTGSGWLAVKTELMTHLRHSRSILL